MKKIYEAENPALVWSARVIVEDAGIPCTIRNEFAGGASGLLSPLDAWPELWVIDDRHAQRAQAALSAMSSQGSSGPDWACAVCGEINGDSFGICWKCAAAAPMT
jgi:hypothetical protein